MLWRLAVVVGVLALATVAGLVRQRRTGRFRPAAAPVSVPVPTPAEATPTEESVPAGTSPERTPAVSPTVRTVNADTLGSTLGSRATLLQFSSAFCAPCRATRVVLADVARIVPGVQHIEIDAESHLDLVRELKVLSTPTVFVLDAGGTVVSRATGLPRRQFVIAALADAIPETGPDPA
jgi:thiol-disulfide isomerase/thioredoxin